MNPGKHSILLRVAMPLCLLITAVLRAQVPLDPWLAALPVEERIMQAPVFENPIVFVGDQPPDLRESQDLWSAIDVMRQRGPAVGIPAIEAFVQSYSNSVWTPSLRADLGYFYRGKGRYSLAMAHWEAAWEATKLANDNNGKRVADFVLANYTRLLASLGRVETLSDIFQETANRELSVGPWQQVFHGTREAFRVMVYHPEIAYRCGSLALKNVAQVLQPDNYNAAAIPLVSSPQSGFSLSALKALADSCSLNMVATYRSSGTNLVVPSVVHWSLNHYAAITAREGNRYKVEDPTFEHTAWMDADTINAEASGYFLIPLAQRPSGWTVLAKSDTDLVFGRGYPNLTDDNRPEDCPKHEDGNGSADTTNPATDANSDDPAAFCPTCNVSGGPPESTDCTSCPGSNEKIAMPVWKVVEPYVDLYLNDTPLFYTKSYGMRQLFTLTYKQRDSRDSTTCFGFGPSWECNLLNYFHQDSGGNLKQWVMNGGLRSYQQLLLEYKSLALASTSDDGNGGVVSGVVELPEGIRELFSNLKTNFDGTRDIFISQQVDRYGHVNVFNYSTNNGKIHLDSVTDGDGRSMTLSYTNTSFPHVVTGVQDPYNRAVQLRYDSLGRLTNIVDVAGISSSFLYDTNGWITNLVTPYGTTAFAMTGTTTNFSNDPTYSVNRSCIVSEPNGSKQMFIYRFNSYQLNDNDTTILIDGAWPTNEVPSLPYSNTLNNYAPQSHNSFHWNRQQYSLLNTTFRSSGNFDDLTVGDYLIARRRHWLSDHTFTFLSGTIDVQKEASPDGTTPGQTTWYDYAGKPVYQFGEGTNSRPSTIARVLPNGQTHYEYFQYNSKGNLTLKVTNYGDGSTARTNQYAYYSNGQDLAYEIGPRGNTLQAYSYNTNHQILTFTNAVGDVTQYSYDSQHRVSQRVLPSGLTNIYTYGADGFISQVTDQPINRTQSYTYSNSFVRTYTDARGLVITNYWDNLQRLTGVLYPDTTVSNIYTYLDLTATKDRLNHWAYSGYNAIRQKIAETNVNNTVTRYGYCDCGSLLYVTNAFGTGVQEITSFAYDYQGNRTYIFYPDGTIVTNWFDSLRRPIATGDGIGVRWFGYNNQGLLTSITNAVGVEQRTTFDVEDRATNIVDANAVSINQTFDDTGRLLTRTYPDNGVERFTYTARGLTNYVDQLSKTNWYVFDATGRKTSETNANNEIIKYVYSAASDLLTLTDGKSQVTTWNYDQYGRVTNKLDQASVEILRYKYDAESRLTNRWSKAKGDTYYTYDNIGNLTFVNYPTSTDITFQCDALNRLTNMVDAVGTTAYSYWLGGLLHTEDGPWSNDTVSYTNNTGRLRQSLTLQQPTGTWTQTYGYDGAHRLTNTVSPAGTFSYTYQGAGKLVQKLLLPNTSYITNIYDSVARRTGTYLKNSGNANLNYHTYLYNQGNQRTQQARSDASTVTYTYDNIGQLKTAVGSGGLSTENLGYKYDAAWNLNQRTNAGTTYTFNVDSKNQLTSDPSYTDNYDSNGNLSSRTNGASLAYSYAYDDENQLTSVAYQDPAVSTTLWWRRDFVYDGRGRMRDEFIYNWSGTNWSQTSEDRHIYDGSLLIQERASATSFNPTISYTRGIDLSGSFQGAGGIGGMLDRSSSLSGTNWTIHRFYFADGNGNITSLVDTNQTVVGTTHYDPFGNTIFTSGVQTSFGFSSKEAANGLYYYGYRFYDPNLQRWLNRDPVAERGGLNLYGFVLNSPANFEDLLGLDRNHNAPPSSDYVFPKPPPPDYGPWDDGYMNCYLKCMGLDIGLEASAEAGGSKAVGRYYYTQKYPTWFKAGGRYSRVLVPRFAGRINGPLALLTMCVHIPECIDKCMHEGEESEPPTFETPYSGGPVNTPPVLVIN